MHASLVCDVNELNLYISVDLDLCYHRPIMLLTVQTKQAAYHFRIVSKTTLAYYTHFVADPEYGCNVR